MNAKQSPLSAQVFLNTPNVYSHRRRFKFRNLFRVVFRKFKLQARFAAFVDSLLFIQE